MRCGYRYQGKTSWNEKHLSYLRGLTLPHPAQKAVLEDTVQSLDRAAERIARLEESMEALLEDWALKPVVKAIMGMRGFALIGAMVIVSELGGAWRFEHPRQLMAYLGLVPTESSSGGKRSQGAISKTGNCHARWIMIEASHHYRLPPGISPQMSQRQEGLSEAVKACAWKAQTRLHARLRQLLGRGKNRNKAQVAVARELCGVDSAAASRLPHPCASLRGCSCVAVCLGTVPRTSAVWEIFRIMHRQMTGTEIGKETTGDESELFIRNVNPRVIPQPKRRTAVPA